MEIGRKNRHTQKQKNLFTMTSGGFMIIVTNNSLNTGRKRSLEPT